MTDLIFLVGAALLALTFPLTVRAFSSSRHSMRPVILCILAGGACVVHAMHAAPGTYDAAGLPGVVVRIIQTYIV